MSVKARTNVIIEEDIVKEIDRLIGKKKRTKALTLKNQR